MIHGHDAASVKRARESLELLEETYPLTPTQLQWFAVKQNAAMICK